MRLEEFRKMTKVTFNPAKRGADIEQQNPSTSGKHRVAFKGSISRG